MTPTVRLSLNYCNEDSCGLAQVKVRGLDKVRAAFIFAMAAYNIVRLPKLMATRGEPQPAT